MTGDFVVSATAERTALTGKGTAGLSVVFGGDLGFADVFFVGNAGINANILVQPSLGSVATANASANVTFRISRTDNTLTLEVNDWGRFPGNPQREPPKSRRPRVRRIVPGREQRQSRGAYGAPNTL